MKSCKSLLYPPSAILGLASHETRQAEFQVSPEEKEGVRKTFSIMATMLRPRTTTALDFLDRPEPLLLMPELDFEFLPTFSRASRPDPRPENPLRFENVPNSEAEEARILLPPVQVMSSDDDLPRQNMRVVDVDGWGTIICLIAILVLTFSSDNPFFTRLGF